MTVRLHFLSLFKFLVVGLALMSFLQKDPIIKYMMAPTIESSLTVEEPIVISYEDTLSGAPIFLHKSNDGIPLYYFKKIREQVCYDSECRLLDIVVYWNITGRYLGFELPKKEFLSKTDHEPFSESEYQRLHSLLADSSIPLDAVSFDEIAEKPSNKIMGLDAISGATSKNIAEMVVKGAAYTTYKLWNIVNGPTMDHISNLTNKQLNSSLTYLILQSSNGYDRLWALNHLDKKIALTSELKSGLLEIIASEDFYLSLKAIQAISPFHLNDRDLQERLFSMYGNINYSIQKEILKTLTLAPTLSDEVIIQSRAMLNQLNGQQLDAVLKLYEIHEINDLETSEAIAGILDIANRYVSKKAYDFLIKNSTNYPSIFKSLEVYEANN